MNKIDERMLAFFKEHHVLSIASVSDGKPWCSNMFYTFRNVETPQSEMKFIFTSEDNTLHVEHFNKNNSVAGSIVLETQMVGKIQGIQFSGQVRKLEGEEYKVARIQYLKRFPVALLHKLALWEVDVVHLKMTDNRLGFGTKLIWNKTNILSKNED